MKGAAYFEHIAGSLSRDGSLWFESGFCKGPAPGALLFSDPVEVVTLSSLFGLEDFFRTLEEKHARGYFLAGWLSYEAGQGFERSLLAAAGTNPARSPLAWFGVYRSPERFSYAEVEELFSGHAGRLSSNSQGLTGISLNLSFDEYAERINVIKDEISAGNVYQVNYTLRYRFSFSGSASTLFSALRMAQPGTYTAFLNTAGRNILSFSPELFFSRCGSVIETMPMKGTAPRGISSEEDSRLKEGLGRCEKNLAENLMIVDLLRNDLGRICRPGSVDAGKLFATQTYPTLHQMVSTIRGEEKGDVGLYELFRALYPSGSITGAPKITAMKLIQSLESEPRGVYTGTIGFITPERDMVFNVAIRTLELSGQEGIYGSGSGIVWDSDPAEEYRECRLKARMLECAVRKPQELFESILWSGSYLWLDEHLDRLCQSSAALGFFCDKTAAILTLGRLEEQMRQSGTRFKVRLILSRQGEFSAGFESVGTINPAEAVPLCLAGHRTDSGRPLLYHKTSERDLYDRYYLLARQKGFGEVIFVNERGEVTEGAISTLFISRGGRFFTPPVEAGLLDGIFRRYFLATRPFATEKIMTLTDLLEADMLYIANSVRGLRPAVFNGDEIFAEGV